MKYDVFISYSREDADEANKICEALSAIGVSYWIDNNIKGSANFLQEITNHIVECKVVLFIASKYSAASPWTQKEIIYAIKHNKHILPYRINEFAFESTKELEFVFSNVQWIESREALMSDILEICKESAGETNHQGEVNPAPKVVRPTNRPQGKSGSKGLLRALVITCSVVCALLLAVVLYLHYYAAPQQSDGFYDKVTAQWYESQQDDGKYPITRIRKLVPEDLAGLSDEELKLMRNEIYARHGYTFKSSDVRSYFMSQPWYKPRLNSSNAVKELSDVERYNIDFIGKYEQSGK